MSEEPIVPSNAVSSPELETTVFLQGPPPSLRSTEQPGDFVGNYRLMETLGEGGFGTVWRAEQTEPLRREVALKVIKAGMDSADIIARFEAERQTLALMEHPNIASVLDAGTTRTGRPFFVMELVRGRTITDYCDAKKFSIRQRLELFIPVCQAVQHAHQKAILHRDLKPSNILVTEVDGKPVPKVIDFGIAKALGSQTEIALQAGLLQTVAGAIIGTPQYMSPEQAGATGDLDTRSDIYTLGVILYELLTGAHPVRIEHLKKAALDEVLRLIREGEPARPSSRQLPVTEVVRQTSSTRGTEPGKLARSLRGDLDWITLKALEKDRNRRYESAAALALDLERHLKNEPVAAGPPSAMYRVRKLVRRNRLAFAAAAAVIASLVAGIVTSTLQAARAKKAEVLATNRLHEVEAQKQRADNEAALAKAVNDFLEKDLLTQAGARAQAGRRTVPDPSLTVREALNRAVKYVGPRFRNRPVIEAEVRDTIGRAYYDLGDAKSAAAQLQLAVKLRSESLGAEHPSTLDSRYHLGFALQSEGKLAEAAEQQRAVLAARERVLGPEHLDTFASRIGVADALADLNRPAEAEAAFRALLPAMERVFGPEDPDVLTARNDLALAMIQQGRHAEAEKGLRALLAVRERLFGPDNPDTFDTQHSLVETLFGQNKLVEAENILRALIATEQRVQGPDHPDTLNTRNTLAVVLISRDKLDEAESELRVVLPARERILGPEHHDTLSVRSNLAELHGRQGKSAQAEAEFRALLALREKKLGTEHPDTLATRHNMANQEAAQGKFAEAEKEHRSVLALRERKLGAEHPETLTSYYFLARCLEALNQRGAALPFAKRALTGREKVLGKDHSETALAKDLVGRLESPPKP